MRKGMSIIIATIMLINILAMMTPTSYVRADNDPIQPPEGSTVYVVGAWNVTDVREYRNCTIIMEGNITVKSGGNLTLHNVTVLLNNSATKQWKIDVWDGGAMYVLDWDNDNTTTYDASNITVNDTAFTFLFLVRDGSIFEMRNSEIHHCGTGVWTIDPPAPYHAYGGLYIETDNVIIDHNLISNNLHGVILYGSNGIVSNNTISWNDHTGVEATAWSNGTIENNIIEWSNTYGVHVNGVDNVKKWISRPFVRGNLIYKTGRDGINTGDALQITNYGRPTIKNTRIIDWGEDGIYMTQRCALDAESLFLQADGGNYNIVGGGGQNYVNLTNSTILSSVAFDVALTGTYTIFTNTTFNGADIAFGDAISNLTVNWFLNTYVNDTFGNPIPNANVRIKDNANGTYDKNFTTDANGYLNWTVLREYYQTQSTFIDYNPYNITVERNGYFSNYSVVQMNTSKYITITLTPVSEYNISLDQGWNLVSLPLEQSDVSIDHVLNSITGKWNCIQTYDPLSQEPWKTNATFKPDQLNDFDTLDHKIGFWINITEPGGVNLTVSGYEPVSTSIPLKAGWNLVGYPTLNNSMTVANALFGTTADRVEVFDPGEPYRIKEVTPTYVMKPGEGYWIHVVANSTWVIDW